jgi:hypothetical protein
MELKDKKEKSLLHSLKTVGVIVIIIAILLMFFSLQAIIEGVGKSVKNSITGEAVYIAGGNESESNVTKDYFEGEFLCWVESGLTEQDLIVAGNLLKDLKCPMGEKAEISAKYEDNCVIVNIDGKADTKLCSKRTKPVIIIKLESSEELPLGMFPDGFDVPENNYYWYVLFFLIIFVVVLFWTQYEMSVKTEVEIKIERERLRRRKEEKLDKRRYLRKVRIKKKDKKEDIVHIMPAPLYDEKKVKKKEKEKKKIENKLKKDQEIKLKETIEKKNEFIVKFNKLSEETNKLIIAGKLIESRKNYLELFDVYSNLITLVNKKNRVALNNAMEYLCNYLGVLEKIKDTKREGFEQKSKKIKEETIRPKPKVVSMDQLEEMKELLKEKQYDLAKKMFYENDVEHFDQKDHNVVVKSRNDKLDEIELRHDKLLEKGVVKVDENDFYKFMYDLTLLRKELRNRGKSKRNKKKG